MSKPLFDNPTQAITVLYHSSVRQASLLGDIVLGCVHLLLLMGLAALMWWFHLTPEQVQSFALDALASKTLTAVGAVGFSALTVLGLYVALIRWVWRRTFVKWMATYLVQDIGID